MSYIWGFNAKYMDPDTGDWDKRDYLGFVLLYLARADGTMDPKEVHYIHARIGEESLDRIRRVSEDCNDHQCLEIMQALRQRFYPGDLGKASLETEMREFCSSEGHYSRIETRLVQLISRQI